METNIDKIITEIWNCDDKRLPKSNNIARLLPDDEFVNSMIGGQWQPICICHDLKTKEWNLAFGRKRLLATRIIKERGGEGKIWVRIIEGTRLDADKLALIENAQRSANEVGDYLTIKHILFTDPIATYKSIAKSIGKLEGYVKHLDTKYAKVPQWVLDAVLEEKIVETVAVNVGKLSVAEQEICKKHFDEHNKLPQSVVSNTRRFIQQNAVASMTLGITNSISNARDIYGRGDLENILKLLDEKKYAQARTLVIELLSQ